MAKLLLVLMLVGAMHLQAQELRPGFDTNEYIELLRAYARWGDSSFYKKVPESRRYRKNNRKYRSEEVGFLNSWEMYETPTQTVISIRGTTDNQMSWMSNFYAAMIPAQGKLQINDSTAFEYQFARHSKATVHVGWAVSTAYLMPDILQKVRASYSKKRNDIIIFGHSQGAGIAFLVTAQLRHYQSVGVLPADIRFKTYCSAAPKPGNLYFAYDYEYATQPGWSLSVVNAADWVPEVPITVQTLQDFNETNPFKLAKDMIKKMPFPNNIAMRYMYNQLTKHNRKAVKKYKRFLGDIATRFIAKELEGYEKPEFQETFNYVRTGSPVILMPDAEYYKKFPDNDSTLFVHHGVIPYTYLAEKIKP